MDPTWRHYQARLNGEPSKLWLLTMAAGCIAAATTLVLLCW